MHFYEIENLIEKKKLEEDRGNDAYAPSVNNDPHDGYVGRSTRRMPDPKAADDAQRRSAWERAKAAQYTPNSSGPSSGPEGDAYMSGDVKYMANPRDVTSAKASQYVPSVNVKQGAADGIVGRRTNANPEIVDQGAAYDKEVGQQSWDAAVAADPSKAIFEPMRAGIKADKRAAAGGNKEDLPVDRRGTGITNVKRGGWDSARDILNSLETPEADAAGAMFDALYTRENFGRRIPMREFGDMSRSLGLTTDRIREGLEVLRKIAGDQFRFYAKTADSPAMVHIVNPEDYGAEGSALEEPELDPEDVRGKDWKRPGSEPASDYTAGVPTGGPKGDAYAGRTTRGVRSDLGPQKEAPKTNKLAELIASSNRVIQQLGDRETVQAGLLDTKHTLEDLGSMENKLKELMAEHPEAQSKYKEIQAIKKEIERLEAEHSPAREWFDIYESMCLSGI